MLFIKIKHINTQNISMGHFDPLSLKKKELVQLKKTHFYIKNKYFIIFLKNQRLIKKI